MKNALKAGSPAVSSTSMSLETDLKRQAELKKTLGPLDGSDPFLIVNIKQVEVEAFAEYHTDFLTTMHVVRGYIALGYRELEGKKEG